MGNILLWYFFYSPAGRENMSRDTLLHKRERRNRSGAFDEPGLPLPFRTSGYRRKAAGESSEPPHFCGMKKL